MRKYGTAEKIEPEPKDEVQKTASQSADWDKDDEKELTDEFKQFKEIE